MTYKFRQHARIVFAAGLLGILGLSAVAYAQDAFVEPEEYTAGTIELPFDAETDGITEMPADVDLSDAPVSDSRVVIGEDEREPVLSRMFPWSAMGRLEWQLEGEAISTCTATLVGPDAILTNSHCLILPLPNGEGEFVDTFVEPEDYPYLIAANESIELKLVFKPSLIDGVAFDEAEIMTYEAGWSSDYSHPKDDWAVLELDQPLGNSYGFMGWRNLDFNDEAILEEAFEKINLLGYAGDFPTVALQEFGEPTETAGVDLACSVLGIWPEGDPLEDTIVHDCDTNPGASGGPIFAKFADNQYYLVGLHARSTPLSRTVTLPNGVDTDVVNGGVTVERWQDAAARAAE
ncbi:MAG: trypsin-like peptidase domain-containing protein [Cyanobacteria bacterium J06554_6]